MKNLWINPKDVMEKKVETNKYMPNNSISMKVMNRQN